MAEAQRVKHWVETIAQSVLEQKKEPFIIAAGITTSGPCHLGTVAEFLYPSAVETYLKDAGCEVEFVFVGDLMDALDSIPLSLQEFTSLKEELGKPLCKAEDPFGCCRSYGEHFLNQIVEVMDKFEVYPKVLRSDNLYAQGCYDRYAALFLSKINKVREILERVSMRKLPTDWLDAILPICGRCGKIATTRVTGVRGNEVQYSCDKDVGYAKGCGYVGETKLEKHAYKLMWRLDWPSRQDFLNVSVEGAGVDHHTRGGSWDTAVAIHTKMFGKEPPVGFKYGFILFKGKKYSKSKALGLGVQELLDLAPPCLVKYLLFKPDVEENKEFDPSGHELIELYESYEAASRLSQKVKLTRGEQKALLAYKIAGERAWKSSFLDVLISYQLFKDWRVVSKRVNDEEGASFLRPYIEKWIEYGYVPPDYVFSFSPQKVERLNDAILTFAEKLRENMVDVDVHNLVFKVARLKGVDPPQLFKVLYESLIGKEYGPRFGKLVTTLGVAKVKDSLLRLYRG